MDRGGQGDGFCVHVSTDAGTVPLSTSISAKWGIAMAKYTKKIIMDTFMNLLEDNSLDKISVKDIVEECEINRNTFYYYYSDIYDLLEDVFRTETEKFLVGEVREDITFFEEYRRAADIILNYRKAVIHIYNSRKRDVLHNYLQTVSFELIGRFVRREAKGYDISAQDIEYIIRFYSYAIVGNTMDWIERKMPTVNENFILKISNTFSATVKDMILDCVNNKA